MVNLLLFSLPVLGASVLQSLNGSINGAWVGHLIGEVGVAATANANLIIFLITALIFGFGTAATIMIGRSMGGEDLIGARTAIGSGLTLFLALGLLGSLIGWIGSPALLNLLQTPTDVFPSALVYLRTMFLGLPLSVLTVFLAMALRGAGDSLTPLLTMISGTMVDVVLNPALILGLGPLPTLGILGSGIATIIANLVTLMILVGIIYARDLPVRLRGPEFRYLIPSRRLIRQIVMMGIPMGAQAIVMAGSTLIVLGLINQEGTSTVAAFGATNQLWTYVQMPGMAIGLAVSAMAAQSIGATAWDRIDRIAWVGISISILATMALVVCTVIWSRPLLGIFLPGNKDAIAIAMHINLLAGWAFILQGATLVLASITRANGATVAPLLIMFLAFVPGRLGAAYGLLPALGTNAIWLSFPVGGVILLCITWIYYRRGSWRRVR